MASRQLTVLQLLPHLEGGGVERGTLDVSAELVRCGHRSLVMSGGGRLVDRLNGAGGEHLLWPIGEKSLWTFRYVRRLRRFLRQERVDILHARSRVPAWIAYLAWKKMDPSQRPRFVTTVHGLYSVSGYSAIMTRGERVIAVSDTARRYILDNYPDVPEERISVIYRGVDRNEFPRGYTPPGEWLDTWYGSYPQLRKGIVLTLAGRLTRLKGHVDFIELIAGLRNRGIDAQGLIVGGEDPRRLEYAREIRDKCTELGVADQVIFTGHRSDVREIYAVSDVVFSLSTKPESFGRTVVEALSLGVPVVGYDHGGVGEILQQLFPQGRVPLGDKAGLIASVEAILSAGPEVEAFSGYTLQSMLDRTIDVYEELLDSAEKAKG
ncbi:MAG: glycosyltransferase family 4 protein [Sedimenticola sp.]